MNQFETFIPYLLIIKLHTLKIFFCIFGRKHFLCLYIKPIIRINNMIGPRMYYLFTLKNNVKIISRYLKTLNEPRFGHCSRNWLKINSLMLLKIISCESRTFLWNKAGVCFCLLPKSLATMIHFANAFPHL